MATTPWHQNCDTIKKARSGWRKRASTTASTTTAPTAWLPEQLDSWLERLGWEALLNTRGTTFRALPDEARQDLDTAKARPAAGTPAMIKRPLLDRDGRLTLGFKAEHYQSSSLR